MSKGANGCLLLAAQEHMFVYRPERVSPAGPSLHYAPLPARLIGSSNTHRRRDGAHKAACLYDGGHQRSRAGCGSSKRAKSGVAGHAKIGKENNIA